MGNLPIKKALQTLKEESQKECSSKNSSLEVIKEVLPALRVSSSPILFKKQVSALNELKIVDMVLAEDNQQKSLILLSKENHTLLIDEICLLIIDLQKFFDTKRSMDEEQIVEIAEMIVGEYRNLYVLDLAFCFKQGKLGKYGKVYDRLDGGIILDWVREWDNKRVNMIIDRRESEHRQHKSWGGGGSRSSEQTLKNYLNEK